MNLKRKNIKPAFGLALVLLLLIPILTTGCPEGIIRQYPVAQDETDIPVITGGYPRLPTTPTKEDIPQLFEDLGSPKDSIRWNASFYLAKFVDEPGVLDSLYETLNSDNANEVRGAAQAFSKLDPMPGEALPELIEAMETGSAGAAIEITRAISGYGVDAAEAVPSLIKVLNTGSIIERRNAAYALGEMSPVAKEAIPHLVSALQEPKEGLAYSAANALGKFASDAIAALPDLVETIGVTWTPSTSSDGINIFVEIGTESIPFLIDGLDDGTSRNRTYIIHSLVGFGDLAIDPLKAQLTHSDPVVKFAAADGLQALGVETATDISDYCAVIVSGEKDDVIKAINKVKEIGPDAGYAIPALIEAGYISGSKVKSYAKSAIEHIGIRSTNNIQGLIDLLAHESRYVREAAIEALMFLGPRAIRAVPILKGMLEDDDTWSDSDVRDALSEILPEYEAVPYYLDMLDRDSRSPNAGAARQLVGYMLTSDEARSAIFNILNEPRTNASQRSIEAIIELGADVVPILIDAMATGSANLRKHCAKIIIKIGPDASEAVGVLIELLDDEDYEVRLNTIKALVEIGPASKEALPKLRDLADNDQYVHTYRMTYSIRRAARSAIEKIEAMEEVPGE